MQVLTKGGCVSSSYSKSGRFDPEKIKAITEWQRPTKVIEIRSFLGLASYYKWFVEGSSHIAMLLTQLTQKGSQKLKEKLITAPILTQSISGKEFMVYSDASL